MMRKTARDTLVDCTLIPEEACLSQNKMMITNLLIRTIKKKRKKGREK